MRTDTTGEVLALDDVGNVAGVGLLAVSSDVDIWNKNDGGFVGSTDLE
jgi:hypothetical protein